MKKINLDKNKILVISDLHLGDKSGSDDFSYYNFKIMKNNEKRLIKKIKEINPAILIFNGDLFELWRQKESKIKKIYKELFSFIEKYDFYILPGNHDIQNSYSKFDKLVLKLNNNKTMLITHGHQNDKTMKNPLVILACFIEGLILKVFPNIRKLFSSLVAIYYKKTGNKTIPELAEKYADKLSKKYDFVILGHTHILKYGSSYLNCGYTQGNIFQGIIINEDNSISLVDENY